MKHVKKNDHLPNRRRALKTMGTLALPLLVPATALGGGGRPAASERITMATIGCGGQGTGDMGAFLGFADVQMVAVCDVVPEHRDRAKSRVDARYNNRDCRAYNDFREVLARDDIDAVLIGTPDHWHAIITIEACKAGKDVYCEKPESLTVREGRAMVEAVRRYGRVFSGGRRAMNSRSKNAWCITSYADSLHTQTPTHFMQRMCPDWRVFVCRSRWASSNGRSRRNCR